MKKKPPRRKVIPVILCVERQRDKVARLIEHCHKLDGTQIVVVEANDQKEYPPHGREIALAALTGLHQVAAELPNRPFFWLEVDSIPLKEGWLAACTKEYYQEKKEFMLAAECATPFLVGGIGIYGPNTPWLIPKTIDAMAGMNWDLFLCKTLPHTIHFSPLIQHRYCAEWDRAGHTLRENRFPQDQAIIRPGAMIFHTDKQQELIGPAAPRPPNKFFHSGDVGDVIASLPILRAQGGGQVVLYHDPHAAEGKAPRESLEGKRYEAIKPLLEVQSYVQGVEWGGEISTKTFREVLRPRLESLTERQARHVGQWPVSLAPWLTVPDFTQHNRVICARSPRYHNAAGFPWREAVGTYGDRILFIGMPDEHVAFEKVVGRKIEHAVTPNFLEIAKLMAGAPQVIANQSAPLWVALGLGSKIICEGDPRVPNSQLPRHGSFWAYEAEDMNVIRRAFAKARKS